MTSLFKRVVADDDPDPQLSRLDELDGVGTKTRPQDSDERPQERPSQRRGRRREVWA